MPHNSLESLVAIAYRKGITFIRRSLQASLISTMLLPAPAIAETIKPKICAGAKDCYRRGASLYENGDYAKALQFFQESYKETNDRAARATLLYNIATTYANLHQPQLAREYFTLYVAENSSEKATIMPLLETLAIYSQGLELFSQKNYTAAVEKFKQVYEGVTKMESLRVTVLHDIGESYEQLRKYDLAAEYYTLYLEDSGHKANDRQSLEAKMEVWKAQTPPSSQLMVPQPAEIEQKSFFQQHTWSSVTASVGAASLIGGMISGYMARSKFNDLKSSCAPGCSEENIDTVATRSSVANGLFVLAGIAASAAVGLYWWESSSQKQDTSSRRIHLTPIGVEGQF